MNKVVKWVRENGTDPILTTQQMDWGNYRTVRWTNALSIRVNINRQYNHRLTKRLLKSLKRGVIGQNLPPPMEDQYIQFRLLMAQLANAEIYDMIGWLRDYWRYHPYDTLRDNDIVRDSVPAEAYHRMTTRGGMEAFRNRMLQEQDNNPRDYLVAQYWIFHP